MVEIKFAPREIFEQILEWAVIPTFDLVIQYGDKGVFIVKRSIAPYKNKWALPGLRMYKNENINDTLTRIAKNELGIDIDTTNKALLGQYVGKFKTEHNRQDISTGYMVKVGGDEDYKINLDHFSSYKLINNKKEIPNDIGAMYKYYLEIYFESLG
jgi:ADP-ribose pyrophosphatase YjhB (NUDIX family)